ncbi:conserved domain protein [Yersinia pestis KIM D27]|nr:conserved domain protein [Yersinia pestis KIM D27]
MKTLDDLIPPATRCIDLLAPPFSGHLHPILALGRMLAKNYEVRIISTQDALARITAAGLKGIALPGEYDPLLQAIANPDYAVKSSPLKLYRQFKSAVGLLVEFASALEKLYQHDGAPDLVIADFTLPVVGTVSKKLGIPWWTSLPSPCVLETLDGPPAYCGGLYPAKTAMDNVSQFIARKKVRWFKKRFFGYSVEQSQQPGSRRYIAPMVQKVLIQQTVFWLWVMSHLNLPEPGRRASILLGQRSIHRLICSLRRTLKQVAAMCW